MIAVDSSVIVAILQNERKAAQLAATLNDASSRIMTIANWLEAAMVIESRFGASGAIEFDALIDVAAIEIAPVTDDIAKAARAGWRRFGKGRHPAALNFGDCFAYGLAKAKGLPLLATGDDFSMTDIALALS